MRASSAFGIALLLLFAPATHAQLTHFGPTENWTGGVGYYGQYGNFVGDVNGDHVCDIIVSNPQGLDVRLSNGNGFIPSLLWTGYFYGNAGNWIADVTGEGRADAIVNNSSNGFTVRESLANGGLFGSNENWTQNTPFYGTYGTFMADVTGDGKADAIVINLPPNYGNGVVVRRSTGIWYPPYYGFSGNEIWSNIQFYGSRGTFSRT